MCRPITPMLTVRLAEELRLGFPDTQLQRVWLSVKLATGATRLECSELPLRD